MSSLMKLYLLGIQILVRPRVFNRSTLTIEESMHVKFEKSNAFVKNVVEIDSLGEDMEKTSLKDSPLQEDKPKDDEQGEVQNVEMEPT